MRRIKKIAVMAVAMMGVPSLALAADFNWGGLIETGYMYQIHPGAGNDDNGTFHAREFSAHASGKMGDTEGYAEFSYAMGNPYSFYGYSGTTTNAAGGAGGAYSMALDQAYLTLHPAFLGGDSWWKWGMYRSMFGFEGAKATGNKMLSRSFNFGLTPTYVTGTSMGKNFGMFWGELSLVNSLNGSAFDNNEVPSFVGALGFGSKDNIYLNASFGYGAEQSNNSGGKIIIDTVVGVNAIQNLSLTGGFDWVSTQTAAGAKNKGWAITAQADYMFHDDMGFVLRFDYLKDKNAAYTTGGRTTALSSGSDLGLHAGVHYALHKNVTAHFEYGFLKPTDDAVTTEKAEHLLAWTTVLHF